MKRQVKIDDCGDWRGLLFCRMLTLAVAVAMVTLARADGTVLYVDAQCATPESPYATPATASTNLALAVAYARANDGAFEIRVKTGTYVETGFVLDKAIQVVGDTGNPADVAVSAESATVRAFTLSDADAAVKNLTVSGKGHRENSTTQFNGGHVNMSAGLVENCVITGSRPTGKTYGANVYMTGGRLVRCQVLDAYYNVDNGYYKSYGMGIYASGGTIESCLVKGNTAAGGSVFNGGHVNISAGLVENCVITGSRPNGKTYGGNVYMTGGRLVRCQVLDAFYSESNGYRSSRGMGIFASGGTIESCLIKGNVAGNGSVFEGGVRLEGTATMVNCTLVGNRNTYADSSCVAGVAVASASAKVVNTVLYDNGGTATKEFGTGNLGCYEYSASSVTNASCATWRVIDATAFKDYGRISADLSGLRPCGSPGTALVRTGCTALDYAEKCGAVSQRDLLGGRRIMGKRLDIGCIAGKPGGLALSIR